MYRLLIVDDEVKIREGLALFDWNSIDIEVADTCENGIEAYQSIRENNIDIVLTDIRMPVMDGLKLIKVIKEEFPYIHVVALSGYDEFEYVRNCLRTGVSDYLLKPIDKNELFHM